MSDTVVADGTRRAAPDTGAPEGPPPPPAGRSLAGSVAALFRLTAGHRRSVAVATALTLAASALGLAQPLVAKHVVDSSSRGEPPWPLLLLLGALFAAEAAAGAVGRFLLDRMGEGVVRMVRHALVSRLLRLEMRELDRRRGGDLVARVTADTTLLRDVVSQALVDLVTGCLVSAGALLLMLWLDPLLLLLVVATVSLAAVAVALLLKGIRAASEHMQDSVGAVAAELERALGALPVVRVYRAEEREARRVGERVDSAYRSGVRAAKLAAVMSSAVELAVQGSFLLVLVVGGLRVHGGGAGSLGDLVAFLLYASYLVLPLSSVFRALGLIQRGTGAYRRIDEALALPEEPDRRPAAAPSGSAVAAPSAAAAAASQAPVAAPLTPTAAVPPMPAAAASPGPAAAPPASAPPAPAAVPPAAPGPSPADPGGPGVPADPADPAPPALELAGVRFGYVPDRPVLRGVSLTVPRRGLVALVGRSGAGKSTLFSLIARLYEPDAGTIRFDGRPAAALGRRESRAGIALVDQNTHVLEGTLRENLTYAAPGAGEDEILRAVRLARLGPVVRRLPGGLDGRLGDRGGTLSAGERQRVALARALLARPRLLLLDEPTSHLDAVNEAALARTLSEATADCAVLVIAHRLSTVQHADRIVVLDDGRTVACGRHDELLTTSPVYRELATAQVLRGPRR
ncbi:ABC transporter ATP-binding protein [Streptomyces cyaneogriseus]|uniref:ABC transporter ATP-binding protein n=1 Tax=Streptomyces cyaneogriseus TaxID=68192 RepID=UPI00099C23DD|nr:ABC transporter ATP-binding protein [Streptomyces cyaneogriseus]